MEDCTSQENRFYYRTRVCPVCGAQLPELAIVCAYCGCQVSEAAPTVVVNNIDNSVHINGNNVNSNNRVISGGRLKSKWVALLLCVLFGYFGIHKFYEGRIAMGVLYLFTGGLFGIGWCVDCVLLLLKPNPYVVR